MVLTWPNAPHAYTHRYNPMSFTNGSPPALMPGAPRPPKRLGIYTDPKWRRAGSSLDFKDAIPATPINTHPKRRRTSVSALNDPDRPHAFLPTANRTVPSGTLMSFPAAHMVAPKRLSRPPILRAPMDDLDDFLSSDLDLELQQTFASASISSPPHHEIQLESESSSAMDISPEKSRLAPVQSEYAKTRPRSNTVNPGNFPLRDVSNNNGHGALLVPPPMPRKASVGSVNSRKLTRPGLPMTWFVEPAPAPVPKVCAHSFASVFDQTNWRV
jgi:hypothetical protein